LLPLPLPGGEAAIRHPWRLAIAALFVANQPLELVRGVDAAQRHRVRAVLEAGRAGTLPMLHATGAGRWFDAAAAILGLGHVVSYDGQAAAELEALAGGPRSGDLAPLPFAIVEEDPFVIDLRPAIGELAREDARGMAAPPLARRFHATMTTAIAAGCRRARAAGAPSTVVLTGGCFQNRILLEDSTALLEADGFEVLVHRRVPCNDGGLALGQAAVAAFQLATGRADVSRHPR
jgi:hydrogenase maturation protein HypF